MRIGLQESEYLAIGFVWALISGGALPMQMALLLYLFYMSKYVEFMDTVSCLYLRF